MILDTQYIPVNTTTSTSSTTNTTSTTINDKSDVEHSNDDVVTVPKMSPPITQSIQQQHDQHDDDLDDHQRMISFEKQELKESLELRSKAAIRLLEQKSRLKVSEACQELYNYISSIEEPLATDSQSNPYRKQFNANKVVDKNQQRYIDEMMSRQVYNEIVAYGLGESRLDSVLVGIKKSCGVNDTDRLNYGTLFQDIAVNVLRLISSYMTSDHAHNIQHVQGQQHGNQHGQSQQDILQQKESISSIMTNISSSSTNGSSTQETVPQRLCDARTMEIISKLLKTKIDAYNSRPLLAHQLAELRSVWSNTSIQSCFKLNKARLPKSYQIAIDKYSVMDRVFGIEPRKLDDSEILQLIDYPLSKIPEYLISNDIRITDVSDIIVEKMDQHWMKVFCDVKVFIWCCSLATFDETVVTPVFIPASAATPTQHRRVLHRSVSGYFFNHHESDYKPSKVNSLSQSIQVFRTLSKHTSSPAIIFFTEKERFAEKLRNGANFKQHFSDYNGGNKDIAAIVDFVKKQFNPPQDSYQATFHLSNFDGKDDCKVITTVLLNIATQNVVD
ncbi:hypothetical protein SAMD00019534_022210, partial [Acytostelium subglobosum LB1]|uniref:hypothetical protein n=1 Tax=Acytostelium subglobosum LB1 TaxID=1410327 RepID=UPI000644DADB